MSLNFSEVMARHTDKKLAAILTTERNQYQANALEAAQKEFNKRNLNLNDFATVQPAGSGSYSIREKMNTASLDAAMRQPPSQTQPMETEYDQARKEQADKDILYGALWCIGGAIATAADIGAIFWGAIVFGAIQFFRGLSNRG